MKSYLILGLFVLGGCQSVQNQWPKPHIPPHATEAEIEHILCGESKASPWYVPCNSKSAGR